jgi:agmatine deiminase
MTTAEATSESVGRMPAEWEPHDACLMAWPTREILWDRYFERAKQEYAATANAISEFEPVKMVTNPDQSEEARRSCGSGVEILEIPIDDSWVRDSGPIFCLGADGQRRGVDFVFNSWGERFKPFDRDSAMSAEILALLGLDRASSPMVFEGGGITVDGEGTAITTEQCLLNTNRNPGMSRNEIEYELHRTLGIEELIWLPWGQAEDAHTDGHVDGACTYVRPGVVLAQTCEDPKNPNYELMAANLEVLKNSEDVAGRALEVIEFPYLPYFDLDGEPMVVSYVNLYIANGAVIVPLADHPLDEPALDLIGRAFPDREVVGVPGRIISFGGGGPHCITQQIPAARAGG